MPLCWYERSPLNKAIHVLGKTAKLRFKFTLGRLDTDGGILSVNSKVPHERANEQTDS